MPRLTGTSHRSTAVAHSPAPVHCRNMVRLADQDVALGADFDSPNGRSRTASPKQKAPWWARTMIIVGAVLMVISVGSVALIYGMSARYNNKVGREDILA